MAQAIEGTFELYFPQGGESRDEACITVQDGTSRARVIELRFDFLEFANAALRSRASGTCAYTLRGLHLAGKMLDSKVEEVPVDRMALMREDAPAAAFLAPFEIDGWKGTAEDLTNYNRASQKDRANAANVRFFRHIGPPALDIAHENEQLRDKVALLRQALLHTKEALPVYSATSEMADRVLERTA